MSKFTFFTNRLYCLSSFILLNIIFERNVFYECHRLLCVSLKKSKHVFHIFTAMCLRSFFSFNSIPLRTSRRFFSRKLRRESSNPWEKKCKYKWFILSPRWIVHYNVLHSSMIRWKLSGESPQFRCSSFVNYSNIS